MKISVIIPIYRVEAWIEACLNSVISQDYGGEIECILINDCTTDNSMAIVENMLLTYNGNIIFRIIHHSKNKGLSGARNTGLEIATGEYIYFLDSDDEITPHCLSTLAKPLETHKCDFVVGSMIVSGNNQEYIINQYAVGTYIYENQIIKDYTKYKFPMMACNKLYRRQFLTSNKLKFVEGLLNEDELWTFQICSLAKIAYIELSATYKYIKRDDSITTSPTNFDDKSNRLATIVDYMRKFAKEHNLANNPHVLSKIDSFYLITLIVAKRCNNKKFSYLYHKLRAEDTFSFCQHLCTAIQSPKNFVRSVHYLLPNCIGEKWLKFILKNKQV